MTKIAAYLTLVAALALTLSFSNRSFAQWIGPPVLVQQPLVDVVELNRFAGKVNSGDQRTFSQNIQRNPNISSASLVYQPSTARRKVNLDQFVAKARTRDPVGAAAMAKLFASTDMIGAIGAAIAPAGLKTNNVADSYAVYWTSAWNASRGSTATPSKAQMTSVKKQAANAMLATPAFIAANEAQKQEYAEALLIQAAMIDSSMEQAKNNPAQLKAVAKAVRQGAKASGLDLDAMTLTDEGFRPAKETGALDGESDVQIASIPVSTNESTTPNYAFIAVAGGAGLGGMFLLGKAMGKKG